MFDNYYTFNKSMRTNQIYKNILQSQEMAAKMESDGNDDEKHKLPHVIETCSIYNLSVESGQTVALV